MKFFTIYIILDVKKLYFCLNKRTVKTMQMESRWIDLCELKGSVIVQYP